jgi:hypothetical protein
MTHTESLAVVEERDHHNAPTRTRVVDVDPARIIEISGLIIDNRYLAHVESCQPVCHATLTLTLDDGVAVDVAAGDHPDPDQAACEINRLSEWLTGDQLGEKVSGGAGKIAP